MSEILCALPRRLFCCPSGMFETYAAQCKFVPFCWWLNLTHSDTYIHGPFGFAAVNGRKTRDRISQFDWDVLATHSSMFHNSIPWFNLPSYSIHVNRGVHIAYCNTPNNTVLRFIADLGNESLIPWQKVFVITIVCLPPHFFHHYPMTMLGSQKGPCSFQQGEFVTYVWLSYLHSNLPHLHVQLDCALIRVIYFWAT